MIARCLSTIRTADRILMLDHGRLVDAGTHDTLITTDGPYRTLAASQLSG